MLSMPASPSRLAAVGSPLLVACAAIGLAGCTGHLNRADGLISASSTDGSVSNELPDLAGRMPGALPANETPSLNGGLDRSTWTPTVVRIERRQVEAQPHYATERLYDHSTARERGEWPTPLTSLEVSGNGGAAALEGVVAPFNAAFDLVAFPCRLFRAAPWSTTRVPSTPPLLSSSVGGASAP